MAICLISSDSVMFLSDKSFVDTMKCLEFVVLFVVDELRDLY